MLFFFILFYFFLTEGRGAFRFVGEFWEISLLGGWL